MSVLADLLNSICQSFSLVGLDSYATIAQDSIIDWPELSVDASVLVGVSTLPVFLLF